MKGKQSLLTITISIIIFCILIGYFNDYYAVWSLWKIDALFLSFADTRNLTSGAESLAMGFDPLYFNPQDPWGRPLNQPRIVQYILSILKINQGHTTIIGILFISLFFIGVFLSLRKINNLTAFILAAVIFSPAVVLGIERGNHDLLIFFLVTWALFLANIPSISMLILLIASFIKLFPIFAIFYFFRYRKKTQISLFAGFITAFLIYLILNYADWQQVFKSTLKWHGVLSYGVTTYTPSLDAHAYIIFAAIIITSISFYINSISVHGIEQGDTEYIDTFRAGAGIYLGTFSLGSVWVYRLMFLILVVPQLVTWTKDSRKGFISFIALVSVGISCWSIWGRGILSPDLLFVVDEIANWVLFITLLQLLLNSMPLDIQEGIIRVVVSARSWTAQIGRLWLHLKTLYQHARR